MHTSYNMEKFHWWYIISVLAQVQQQINKYIELQLWTEP